MQGAIADAKINALNITKALGVKLIRVKQVLKNIGGNYATVEVAKNIQFTKPKVDYVSAVTSNTSFDKFEVEDVELEEKITIVYQISK